MTGFSKLASEILILKNAHMTIENQQNSRERIEKAITHKTVEIKFEIPKYLCD